MVIGLHFSRKYVSLSTSKSHIQFNLLLVVSLYLFVKLSEWKSFKMKQHLFLFFTKIIMKTLLSSINAGSVWFGHDTHKHKKTPTFLCWWKYLCFWTPLWGETRGLHIHGRVVSTSTAGRNTKLLAFKSEGERMNYCLPHSSSNVFYWNHSKQTKTEWIHIKQIIHEHFAIQMPSDWPV